MTFLALLVSTDDCACRGPGPGLPASGIAVERFSDLADGGRPSSAAEIRRTRSSISKTRSSATELLEEARRAEFGKRARHRGLGWRNRARTREILSSGAHFVLYKPLSDDNAKAGLRAVAALLNRERRRAYRVPVQAPVELTLPDTRKIEGILLDLSETGMDVLTAEPQVPGALLNFRFQLPDGALKSTLTGKWRGRSRTVRLECIFWIWTSQLRPQLKDWLQAAAAPERAGPEETVPHCKLTDLSLGGCYVETDSPVSGTCSG